MTKISDASNDDVQRVGPFVREYQELLKNGFPEEATQAYKAKLAKLPQNDRELIEEAQAVFDKAKERSEKEDPERVKRKAKALGEFAEVLNAGASETEWQDRVAKLPEDEQFEVKELSAVAAGLKRALNRRDSDPKEGAAR